MRARESAAKPANESTAKPANESTAKPVDKSTAERVDWTSRLVRARIGSIAHGGHCVARVDGRVVFVWHAIPGELAMVRIAEDRGGSFCRGDVVEVLEPSAERVPPPCPVATPDGCGGCDFQHITHAAQRKLKADVVAEQLRRLAKLDVAPNVWGGEVEQLPGGSLGWRSRVRLAVDGDGRAGFRAHRSNRVVPIEDCAIAAPGMLVDVLARRHPPGTEIVLASDDNGTVHINGGHIDDDGVADEGVATEGVADDMLLQRAAGRQWRLSVDAFWQPHREAARVLADAVAGFADAPAGGLAWDLYGGVGLFAAVLAGQVGEHGEVRVVESARRAVADGEANLADVPQVRFVTARVERALASGALPGPPDVVVLDPPRKGAGRDVVHAITAAGPSRVVYVSCDPASLARDIATFAARGYPLARLRAFDAFPMTQHVECVALLTKAAG